MIKKFRKKSGVSLILCVLGLVTILTCAGLAVDLGMVVVSREELQKAVESAALAGVSVLEPSMDNAGMVSISLDTLDTTINDVFNTIRAHDPNIATAVIANIEHSPLSKAVRVTATSNTPTYFLGVLGLRNITIQARVSALNFPVYLDPRIPKVPSIGSVLTASTTDISINNFTPINNIYHAPDGNFTQTKSGGYVTIRLPVPIVDLPGADLYVCMRNVQGYYIYIGADVDPNNPYISANNPGSGIKWVNIGATGIPVSGSSTAGPAGAYQSNIFYNDTGVSYVTRQPKFYGSGVFDIGRQVHDSSGTLIYDGSIVKTARYIKIVDDAAGDTVSTTLTTKQFIFFNPGIKIDAIGVLHHARLIRNQDFDVDTDKDGAIDILERMMNSNPFIKDSDFNGVSDGVEFVGWNNNLPRTAITQVASNRPRIDSPRCANYIN